MRRHTWHGSRRLGRLALDPATSRPRTIGCSHTIRVPRFVEVPPDREYRSSVVVDLAILVRREHARHAAVIGIDPISIRVVLIGADQRDGCIAALGHDDEPEHGDLPIPASKRETLADAPQMHRTALFTLVHDAHLSEHHD
jgi:hypothetical protein